MQTHHPVRRSQRGAVLVHVAVGLVALLGFSALAVDYGVLWLSRRQAQNAADAAALSAGISLAFVDHTDQTLARDSAMAMAQQHAVWDGAPDITASDVTFAPCPSGAPGVPDTCVRADVFRNQRSGGSPLPTFFGQVFGVTSQGVRATATAQMLVGDTSDCVKPWAIPDKWLEYNPVPAPWTPDKEFERYVQRGRDKGVLMDPADEYIPPSVNSPGTGFKLPDDYGRALTLKHGNPHQAIAPSQFYAVVINPAEGRGANTYRENIATCDSTLIGPGTILETEPGNMVGPTRQGVTALIEQDPSAWWDATANGGLGAPAGGCMADGSCKRSPRLIAVPVFDPDIFDAGRTTGRIDVVVTNVLGFWLEGMQGNDVVGYLTYYPSVAFGSSTVGAQSAFLRTVILVR